MLIHRLLLYIILLSFLSLPVCFAARLETSDLVYEGAFRLPDEYNDGYQWQYGGKALAFRPDGDSEGPADGYTGSLYAAGKKTGAAVERDICEFTIPIPVDTATLGNMNTASTLQTWNDITDGLFDTVLSGHQ